MNKSPTPTTKARGAVFILCPAPGPGLRDSPALTQITSIQAAPPNRGAPGVSRVAKSCLDVFLQKWRHERLTRGTNRVQQKLLSPMTEIAGACFLINPRRWETVVVKRFPHAVSLWGGINIRALLGKTLIPISFISVLLSLLRLRSDGFTMGPSAAEPGRQPGRTGNAAGSRPLTLSPSSLFLARFFEL